jgi:tyrosyl-tRNA synthetase
MSKVITDKNRIKEALEKGVERIYPNKEALEKVLISGKRIRLYCGYDPTAPSLHLGHAITLRKLAQFQALGHEVIMLIGDFTAMIGDPTDKTAARKRLTKEQVHNNLKNYKKQASKILKFSGKNSAKVMFNSKWNSKLTPNKLIDLAFSFSVQQMLVRDMFRERLAKDKQILLPEFLYPLFQAYDSVALDVDLEIGGSDQTFNMLRGRDLMKALKNKEKFVLATKLLVDPTGKKMGKTEGNMINLDDKPSDMYGKIMSWPDSLIIPGFELCTDLSIDKIKNPRDAKAQLAREIVTIYHGRVAALDAGQEFNRIFKEHRTPEKVKSCKLKDKSLDILTLLVKTKLAPSKSEAKRLIEHKGVKIDEEIVDDWKKEIIIEKGMILQVGKRKFIKLI